jgi:hypothetical protein
MTMAETIISERGAGNRPYSAASHEEEDDILCLECLNGIRLQLIVSGKALIEANGEFWRPVGTAVIRAFFVFGHFRCGCPHSRIWSFRCPCWRGSTMEPWSRNPCQR